MYKEAQKVSTAMSVCLTGNNTL